jgi:hypothetical protein
MTPPQVRAQGVNLANLTAEVLGHLRDANEPEAPAVRRP